MTFQKKFKKVNVSLDFWYKSNFFGKNDIKILKFSYDYLYNKKKKMKWRSLIRYLMCLLKEIE